MPAARGLRGLARGGAGTLDGEALERGLAALAPSQVELVDARQLGAEPEWRCGHQVADVLLDAVQERCERSGDLTRALLAATLRRALPFDETAQDEAAASCVGCARA